jgi:hypothetical protein
MNYFQTIGERWTVRSTFHFSGLICDTVQLTRTTGSVLVTSVSKQYLRADTCPYMSVPFLGPSALCPLCSLPRLLGSFKPNIAMNILLIYALWQFFTAVGMLVEKRLVGSHTRD